MPSIFFYILKLSVALVAVYLFYQLVLRRLTFYNWNRWYLLGYTILAFLIPFINITPILESNEWSDVRILNWVPVINEDVAVQNIPDNNGSILLFPGNILIIILISGALFLFVRLILQFISFNRMRKKAKPFTENGLTIYQVNENIIPFSFGNSIFINHQLHSEEELREIIKHEFIHVKQKHSIDIIWGELLFLLNWYNPFAWLLKRSIRQNLEFIADNKVVQNGIDKKEYQYLLLKVIGNSQFCIATQFNFSSLKKRIVMMNKTKSTKRQLLRMLFLLPATAMLLLAFRNKFNEPNEVANQNLNSVTNQQVTISDTIPANDLPKDYKEFLQRNPQIENLRWSGGPFRVTINLKNGSKETYNLEDKKEIATLEKKYGKLPVTPPLHPGSVKEVEVTEKNLAETDELAEVKEVAVAEVPVKVATGELAEVTVIETPLKKAVSTTGEIKEVTVVGKPLTKTIATNSDLQEVVVTGAPTKRAVSTTGEIKEVTVAGKPSKVATTVNSSVVTNIKNPNVNVVSEANTTSTTNIGSNLIDDGDLDIKITITKGTTPEQLEKLTGQLKEKGYELKFTNKDYNDGILTQLSGTIKYKGTNSSFSFSDFDQAIIKVYREGDNVEFRIYTGKNKVTL